MSTAIVQVGGMEKVLGNSVSRRARGSFGEIAGVIGLLPAIGIGAFLHALRVIIISAITATPSCLESNVRVSAVGKLGKGMHIKSECSQRKRHQANQRHGRP